MLASSGQAKAPGGRGEPAIESPQRCALESRRNEKMDVDPSDAAGGNVVPVDELEGLVVVRGLRSRQLAQQSEDLGSVLQTSESELADDERVHHDVPAVEQGFQPRIAAAQVLDPDGSVDEVQDA